MKAKATSIEGAIQDLLEAARTNDFEITGLNTWMRRKFYFEASKQLIEQDALPELAALVPGKGRSKFGEILERSGVWR